MFNTVIASMCLIMFRPLFLACCAASKIGLFFYVYYNFWGISPNDDLQPTNLRGEEGCRGRWRPQLSLSMSSTTTYCYVVLRRVVFFYGASRAPPHFEEGPFFVVTVEEEEEEDKIEARNFLTNFSWKWKWIIAGTQCGNCMIFLSLKFYVQSILKVLELQKISF